jgi:CBS-domain-containing membrane protein
MSPVVPKVRATDVLQAITEAFTTTGTHRLIVIDDEERVVGLISDADIIKRLPKTHHRALLSALRGSGQPPALALTAAELMSEGALTALPDTSVAAALQLMMPPGRKWIVVVDEAAKPLGLVDRATLLAALAGT